MGSLPVVTGRDAFSALVIRTDYNNDAAWQEVTTALLKPFAVGECNARVHFIDDPVWAAATVDEVLTALGPDDDLAVVFLADRTTMRVDSQALLAITTLTRQECVDDEDYEQLTRFGRTFRIVPAGVHEVHVNLSIGNLGFEEYAAWAHEDPEKTLWHSSPPVEFRIAPK